MKRMRLFCLLLLASVALGCQTYNAAAYQQLASQEQAAVVVDVDRCNAHDAGAAALRDEDGGDRALAIPMGSGLVVKDLAYRHDRQAAVCREYVDRSDRTSDTDGRILDAWKRQWKSGSATVGGSF